MRPSAGRMLSMKAVTKHLPIDRETVIFKPGNLMLSSRNSKVGITPYDKKISLVSTQIAYLISSHDPTKKGKDWKP